MFGVRTRWRRRLVVAISLVGCTPVLAQRAPNHPQADPGGGVVLEGVQQKGELTTFRYVVRNPTAGAGLLARIVLDLAAPRTVGVEWLGVRPTLFVLDVLEKRPNAAIGHAPVGMTCPTGPGDLSWISGIDGSGGAWCEVYGMGVGEVVGIAPGGQVTFTLDGKGVPFLRVAKTLPWAPLPTVDEQGRRTSLPYPPGVSPGREQRTLVAGPGLPVAFVTLPVVKEQVTLACDAQLLAAGACAAIPALLDRGDRRAAMAALVPDGAREPHPLVALTILRQIGALP